MGSAPKQTPRATTATSRRSANIVGVGPSGHYSLWDNTAVRAPPNDSRSGFWLAVHAVDRSTLARAVGLFRNCSVQHTNRDARGEEPGRHHSLGRTEERFRDGAPKCAPQLFDTGDAGARHLLRHAADDRCARRRSPALGPARVRSRESARDPQRHRRAEAVHRHSRRTAGLGEPRRRCERGAAGICGCRHQRHRADRRDGSAGSRPVRAAVSIPKSRTPSTASASSAISLTTSAAAPATGRSRRSSKKPRSASGNRSATGKVVCGLSGGVDSTVAAMLIHRAIGDRLTCIFVDNGLLRYDEANQIVKRFREKMHLPLDFVDASRPLSRSPRRRRRSRAEAEDHRRHLHRCVRDSARRSWGASISWRRARSTRMSSSRHRCMALPS